MADTPRPLPFPWISQLLVKAIARLALMNSVTAVQMAYTLQYDRSDYIIKVLQAPVDIRIDVRNEAIANVTAGPSDAVEGQKQLVCILTMFETFSATEKAQFIGAYATSATLEGYGSQNVLLENVYQWGQNPPVIPP